jgi:hypothetical protein
MGRIDRRRKNGFMAKCKRDVRAPKAMGSGQAAQARGEEQLHGERDQG